MDPLEQQRNGYSLADCAEIEEQMRVLRMEHGEPGYRAPFQQFLRSKGLTEGAWGTVYNDWYHVLENDPALHAKYRTYVAQVQQRQMISKQPNVSGESMEGVSLEAYAKISAQLQTGAVPEQLVAAEGLTMDQWQRGQAAWAQRMSTVSPTDPIILQYGQLYQKWSPNHQASMEAATARFLEDAADREGRGGGMAKELTLENADEFFDHPDVRVRARGVREMIRIWDLNSHERHDPRMRQLTERAYDEAIRILHQGAGDDRPGILALDRPVDAMDIHAWSAIADQEGDQQGTTDLVQGPLKDLACERFMSPEQNEAAQNAVRQAIARLQPRAAKVEEAFGQATDDLKRTQLRQLVDDYRETLNDLQETLNDWDYNAPEAQESAPSAAMPSAPSAAITRPKPPESSGFLGVLKSLPLIGMILRLIGL